MPELRFDDRVVVVTGAGRGVGIGGVARIAVVHSQGLTKPDLTAEDIAENLDAVLDLTAPQVSLAVPV